MPKKPQPLRRQNDTPAMTEAIDKLTELKLPVRRPSPHQLKCWEANYWPNSGRMFVDEEHKVKERGLIAFLELVEKHAHAKGWRHHTSAPIKISLGE